MGCQRATQEAQIHLAKGSGLINHYEIIIYWSDEDQAFIADIPELPGCMAHGDTHEDALMEVKQAMDLWIEAAKANGRSIPQTRGSRLLFA